MFYDRLFEIDPKLRKLFKEDVSDQSKKLMQMIATAVNALDKLETIVPAVKALGAPRGLRRCRSTLRHGRRGIAADSRKGPGRSFYARSKGVVDSRLHCAVRHDESSGKVTEETEDWEDPS